MNEQAPPGWYPDGQGNDRYWDGAAWTESVRNPSAAAASDSPAKRNGAFGKLGAVVKKAAADKRTAKEDFAREQSESARAAGRLLTSGVFGTSSVEIYEGGYVRIASWGATPRATGPKRIDGDTPYEQLRSIKFTDPEQGQSTGGLEAAVGPAVANIMKGGRALMKSTAPGLTVAGISHLASNEARKALLTIATDKQIHLLTNQTQGALLKSSNKSHNEVGRALEAAGLALLGVPQAGTATAPESVGSAAAVPTGVSAPTTAPTLSDRLRELANLHQEGILSDEEFAGAKSKLLGGL